jgi:hypothetical protein
VADTYTMAAEPCHLIIAEVNAVSEPHAIGEPTDLFEIVERPAAEMMQTIFLLVAGLAEMGVQAAAVLRCERRGINQQLLGDVETVRKVPARPS